MKFEDLKPGHFFIVEDSPCRFLKTQNLYYFNAETESQRMEVVNTVNLNDGQFVYVTRDKEVKECD